jgi:tripartite-type tricarboxylate transporter receptor subunit TctC
VKATSLKELVALAKAEPGKLNFSSPGLASSTFIGGALFRKAAGIDVVHVPYKGAPESVLAVLRGEVQFYFAPINLAKEMAEGGKVRALAVATPARNPSMPDVPTFAEAGLPFTYDGWFGLMAPKGVPPAIIAKINADVVAMLKTPQVQAKLAQQFVIPVTDTPVEFDKISRDETANLTQVFKEAGIGGN